ncbi:MAG: FHA domain-containing protein, partial [Gemmataceae bacterium]|nr:FHA domain-containing protein [Gemmataceae bacterium]
MNLRKRYDIRRGSDWHVWRGQDDATQQLYLIRQVADNSPYQQQLLRRLEQECAFFSAFDHPHLIRPHGLDSERKRVVYHDVQCSLSQYIRAQGPLTPAQVGQVLLQASDALATMHARKVGHGCVNTHTLLVGTQGEIVCGDFLGYDFGAALHIPLPEPELTYQAPEVIDTGLGKIGPSADLYCLGYTALELLLGERFENLFDLPEGVNWLAWHADPRKKLEDWQAALGHIPAGLVDLIAGLIAKPIAERTFGTAGEFADALKRSRLSQSHSLPFYQHRGDNAPARPAAPRFAPGPVRRKKSHGRKPHLLLTPLDRSFGVRRFKPGRPVLVGRSDMCGLVPAGPGVSAKHAMLTCHDDCVWRVYDLGSTSGTFVNGAPRPQARLRPGHVVSFGGVGYRIGLAGSARAAGVRQFHLREMIHEGSHGRLYRADWASLDGRAVALRLFPRQFANDQTELLRGRPRIPEAYRLRPPHPRRLYRAGV